MVVVSLSIKIELKHFVCLHPDETSNYNAMTIARFPKPILIYPNQYKRVYKMMFI